MLRPARSLLLVLALGTAALPAIAARPVVFEPSRLSDRIRELQTDSFEGRPSIGRGQDRTTDSIIFNLRSYDLQPGGDLVGGMEDGEPKRGWTQAVPMAVFETQGGRFSVSLPTGDRALTAGAQIAVRTLRPVPRVALSAAPLVFVGYGIEDASRGWNDFAGVDLRGKVAVALAGDPDSDLFGGAAMTWPGRWTAKIEAAARAGAAGLLIVHDTAGAGYGWATARAGVEGRQYDLVRADPAAAHPLMEGWLSTEAASAIFAGAGQDLTALRARAGQPGFRAVDLTGAALNAEYAVVASQTQTYNVVARLRGEGRGDQAVVFVSHWDGPGAVEATGTAALMELARAYARQTPNARSMVFVFAGGASEGGIGSAHYAANPTYPLSKTAAVIGLGPFDASGPARDMTVVGDTSADLSARLASILNSRQRRLTMDPQPSAGHGFRTDAAPIARMGPPSLTIGSGADLIAGGTAAGQAWRAGYMGQRYRTPADAWNRDMALDGLAQDLDVLYVLGRDLANGTDWPASRPAGDFTSLRALTAGERR